MITLTTAAQINSVLGGNTPIGYDHLVLSPIAFQPFERKIQATIRLTSTTNPDMDVITGSLAIDLGPGTLTIRMGEQINFLRRMLLSPGQITAIQTVMNSAQNQIEAGLITVGVLAGVQSTGA